jgi:quercetin dioxygenase-like cupin family protein
MKINFKEYPEIALPKFKNGEGKLYSAGYTDKLNRVAIAKLEKGSSIGYHIHETSSEIIYVVQGCGIANYNGKDEVIHVGEAHYCPKGSSHSFRNEEDEDLIFLTIVPQQ